MNIEKNITFFVIMLLAFMAHAQIKTYVGIKGGPQVSSIYMDHTLRTTFIPSDFIPAYTFGVVGKVFTKKRDALVNPGLQFGINFDRKGWAQKFPETEEQKYKIKMSYVQLPVEAIINFGRGSLKSFFGLGMYVEYLVDVKKGVNPNLQELSTKGIDFYTYEQNRDRKLGYGVRVSVGAQKDFKFGAINLEVFGTYNVSSVIDHQDFKTGIPDLSNMYTAGFTLGYLIPFGKLDY